MVRRTLGGPGGTHANRGEPPLAPKGFGLPLQVTISCPLRYADGLAIKGFHMLWMYDGPFTGPGGTHASRAEPPQVGRTPIVQSPPGPEGILPA